MHSMCLAIQSADCAQLVQIGIALVGTSSLLAGEGSSTHEISPQKMILGMGLIIASQVHPHCMCAFTHHMRRMFPCWAVASCATVACYVCGQRHQHRECCRASRHSILTQPWQSFAVLYNKLSSMLSRVPSLACTCGLASTLWRPVTLHLCVCTWLNPCSSRMIIYVDMMCLFAVCASRPDHL